MAYYGNMVKPVTVGTLTGILNPGYENAFRGPQEISTVLTHSLLDKPYLLGDTFTAADLLMV
jgi:glutathione S-transferase